MTWLAGDCVLAGDDAGELAGVGGTEPRFKDIDKIAEFSAACSLSCCMCDG